jgi:hypothetical protein
LSSALGIRARIVLSLALIGPWTPGLPAQEPTRPAGQQQQHTVKRGDTLWGLAGFYFTNPFLWPVIYDANRTVVEDPHWIYPGEVLTIPGVEAGLPVVVGKDTLAPEPIIQEATGPQQRPGAHSRFYKPAPPEDPGRRITLAAREEPLYVVPPAAHRSAAWLADTAGLGIRARILAVADPVRQGDRMQVALHPFERLLAAPVGPALDRGDTLLAVRFEDRVEGFGRVIVPVALVRVDSVGATAVAARFLAQYAEATTGDYLIPVEPVPDIPRGLPSPVQGGAEGALVRFLHAEPLYGTADNAFVDLGAAAGLEIGDELIAFVPPRRGPGQSELHPEVVATLQVVKVRPNSATVRVSSVTGSALREGLAVRVVRKMSP